MAEQRKDLDEIIPGWSTGKFTIPEWKFDRKPALILNHMQDGIVGSGTYSGSPVEQMREYMKSHPQLIGNQKKLLAAFRERKLPIFFVCCLPRPLGFYPKWGFIFRMATAAAPLGYLDNPEVREGCQVIPDLERRPEEQILYHTGTSLFNGTNLEQVLRHHGVEELVLSGFTAHSTVYNSVVIATDLYYSVVVPRDSTGSPGRDTGNDDFVFDKLMPMYALVTTTDDVIKHLPQGK